MEGYKKKRSVVMDSMKNLERYVTTVSDATHVEDMKTRVSHAQSLYNKFIEVEDKIITKDPNEESIVIEFEEMYYEVISKLNARIRVGNLALQTDETQHNQTISQFTTDLKLPRTNIPPFDGNYKDWQSFFDLYSKSVHENVSLSAAQKFQLLKGCLKGEAYNLLKHFSITEANYMEAFQKLKDRYDKKKHIINTYIQSYLDIPTAKSATASSLRKLVDQCDEVIRALKAMGPDAESRDPWIILLIVSKLDDESKGLWALHSVNDEHPKIGDFIKFMTSRCDALEAFKSNTRPTISRTYPSRSLHLSTDESCPLCQGQSQIHSLADCTVFKKMNIHERRKLIKTQYRCFNCMSPNHPVFKCKAQRKCTKCRARHHELLHLDDQRTKIQPESSTGQNMCIAVSPPHQAEEINTDSKLENFQISQQSRRIKTALLPTVLVNVTNGLGDHEVCRCLLDSGSQISIITESCVRRLRLTKEKTRLPLTGLGSSSVGVASGMTNLVISAIKNPRVKLKLQAVVLQKVTSQLPMVEIDISELDHLDKSEFADPNFHIPGKIDILIGSEHFFNIIGPDQIINSQGVVQAQATIFGWVIAGQFNHAAKTGLNFNESGTNFHAELDLDFLLRRFWEIEEVPFKPKYTEEELACEKHFCSNVSKTISGRFQVKLPFKTANVTIGSSRHVAVQRLLAMERRFKRDQQFKEMYISFMKEYESLQHMVVIPKVDLNKERHFYLPHHGVLKQSNTTSKLRVVFDASAKSSSGKSLNDCLMVGPTIQNSLVSIILRFRLYKVAFTADIEKMYRQVLVQEEDAEYQRIVWRESPEDEIQDYKLLTVTYGTASAPFLATRVLRQIGEEAAEEQDAIAPIILNDFYVDDVLTGASEVEEVVRIQKRLVERFNAVGFKLRKWSSNCEAILNSIPLEDRELKSLNLDRDSHVKALGLHWNPCKDIFFFKISLEHTTVFTKRSILSEASKLFDPLGWLAPIIILIKIFFQGLWLLELGWDDHLPPEKISKWIIMKENLPFIEKIEIPRWLMTNKTETIELHGFADASELAYGAVIYCRTASECGVSCNIIAAKTKVAPIKQVCLPRLELCAAQLLVKLYNMVKESYCGYNIKFMAWCDSTIVLAWLSSHPRRWSTYVANRVSEILEVTPRNQWRHVRSTDNPADLASRGVLSAELIDNSLWWHGPEWLVKHYDFWPVQKIQNNELALNEERKSAACILLSFSKGFNLMSSLATRISSYTKILRVVCWMRHYIERLKCKSGVRRQVINIKMAKPLLDDILFKREDITAAEYLVFRWAQEETFPSEIRAIKEGGVIIGKRNPINHLHPFLDGIGLLRVGGRLENSSLDYNTKHPILLSSKSLIIKRLVEEKHLKLLHAGNTLLSNSIQERFWILGIDKLLKRVINECLVCYRQKQLVSTQLMGSLPEARVTMAFPFSRVGVDYAGPILVREHNRRGHRTSKAYVAIFVCLCTKAVHIELVGDMTTEAFLAALTRFTSRRGLCSEIFSDNGSNFVGAKNQLKEWFEFLNTNTNNISNFLLKDQINWHMIPPAAPNFGGLWEAAVKSMKFHLKRVMGNQSLTFEEMQTLLVQIEGILNSRPIYSTRDGQSITPSHFLIGRPIISIPQPVITSKISLLSRWRLIEKIKQDLWQTWHKDYLVSLQRRNKWQLSAYNLKINDIVILKDDNLPPSRWALGIIRQVFPGDDGLVRVVSIHTSKGDYKRPINKVIHLPFLESGDSRGPECSQLNEDCPKIN